MTHQGRLDDGLGLGQQDRPLLGGNERPDHQRPAAHRREAHWAVAGVERTSALLAPAPIDETAPDLAPPNEAESLIADYRSLGLTLGLHNFLPLFLLCFIYQECLCNWVNLRCLTYNVVTNIGSLCE